jgi:hypothetical protein
VDRESCLTCPADCGPCRWKLIDSGDIKSPSTSAATGQVQLIWGELSAIGGTAPDDVFVVGRRGVVWRYDGTRWESMSVPTRSDLRAVWGRSNTDVWVVGTEGTVLHFDGSWWTRLPSPTSNHLNGIWGESGGKEVVAVGAGGVAIHFDGSAWTQKSTGSTARLNAVWGSSTSDVWAVGEKGTLLHYDGVSWTATSGAPADADLRAIWGASASQVWAVGTRSGLFQEAISLHFNGASWADRGTDGCNTQPGTWPECMAGSSGQLPGLFTGVFGTSASDVYVVGHDTAEKTWVFHFDGASWSPSYDIGIVPVGVFVTAYGGTFPFGHMFLLEANGVYRNGALLATAAVLKGVWARSDSSGQLAEAVTVGGTAKPVVWEYKVGTWSVREFSANPADRVWAEAVWGISLTDYYIGGKGGVVHAGAFAPEGFVEQARSIWGTGTSNVYAAASTVHRKVSGYWTQIGSLTAPRTIRAIWGDVSGKPVFLAGGNEPGTTPCSADADCGAGGQCRAETGTCRVPAGFILSSNGAGVTEMATPPGGDLRGIWGSGASNVFAVGDGGRVLRYDGASWKATSSPTKEQLNAVWGRAANDIVAVGNQGTVIHHDGKTWDMAPVDIRRVGTSTWGCEDLHSAWGATGGELLFVGQPGVLRLVTVP